MKIFNQLFKFFILVFACCFFACEKDLNNLEVQSDAEFAFPLFFGNLNLKDVIKDSGDSLSLFVGADGQMSFKYSGNIVSRTSQEIYSQSPTIPAVISDTFFGVPVKLNNNISLRKATITDGSVFFTYKSFHKQDVTVKITIPELSKNGKSWTITRFVKYNGTSPVTDIILPSAVAGYKLDLPKDSLHIRYEAIKADGDRDTVSSFAMLVNGLKFSYVEGYFGNELFPIDRDTIYLNIYKNLLGGELYFEDPKVSVNVYNSFGFPVRSKVNIVRFQGRNVQNFDLQSPFVTNGFDFLYPPLNQAGKTVVTSFAFNKNNSNIVDILNASPELLDYQIDAIANPDSDPNIIGFMTDSSYFLVNVSVDLPIHGRAKNFKLENNFESDFGKLDGFQEAEFKLITENKMPLDVKMQLYFQDKNGVTLDSAFTTEQLLIESAPINIAGDATGTTKKVSYIPINNAKMNAIRNTKSIKIKALVSTALQGNSPVKVNANQGLIVKMGTKAKLKSKL
jgi:hypothetical protein